MHTQSKGILGKLIFAFHLIQKGYTVLDPLNLGSGYDLVTEKEGVFSRIQVRYCTPKNGILRVELERPEKIEAIGIYDSVNQKFYLIPVKAIQNKTEVWLRLIKPKNLQKNKINWAGQYEI
ncbi:hypothetical protein HY439_03755 [Candidatus Microgenomates bacterium]|nr:hypothetical protein [Candidatus Microgenomates bacterium]